MIWLEKEIFSRSGVFYILELKRREENLPSVPNMAEAKQTQDQNQIEWSHHNTKPFLISF